MPNDAQPWERVSSEELADYEIFRVLRTRDRSPRTGEIMNRHILAMRDWVNVVAVTAAGDVVLVEQFRHGAADVTLELPAGLIDDDEDPCAAGVRELEEETGFRAASCELLGTLLPNPSLQSNKLHVVLAKDCTATGSRNLDEGEDVHVHLVKEGEVGELIRRGDIRHALPIAAWHLFVSKLR